MDYLTDFFKRQESSRSVQIGGLLALFVNSWLDEQLSFDPSFGPYAIASFFGGAAYVAAAYVADRRTLSATGNPWAQALKRHPKILPHGTQPEWELWQPMWAIDHTTKRIVGVPGCKSADVRTALWAQRRCLRDTVLAKVWQFA